MRVVGIWNGGRSNNYNGQLDGHTFCTPTTSRSLTAPSTTSWVTQVPFVATPPQRIGSTRVLFVAAPINSLHCELHYYKWCGVPQRLGSVVHLGSVPGVSGLSGVSPRMNHAIDISVL